MPSRPSRADLVLAFNLVYFLKRRKREDIPYTVDSIANAKYQEPEKQGHQGEIIWLFFSHLEFNEDKREMLQGCCEKSVSPNINSAMLQFLFTKVANFNRILWYPKPIA
jgi:hypothetical protein